MTRPIYLFLSNALILTLHALGLGGMIQFIVTGGSVGLLPIIWGCLSFLLVICCVGVFYLKSWALWYSWCLALILGSVTFLNPVVLHQPLSSDFWISSVVYANYLFISMYFIRENQISFPSIKITK